MLKENPSGVSDSSSPKVALSLHTRRMRKVSVWMINILPQMRQTFNSGEQEELTGSIATKGMIQAPTVVLYTHVELQDYLNIINKLWNSDLVVEDLRGCRIRGQKRWRVLLAGERRVRSYKPLVKQGVRPRMLQVTEHEHLNPFDAVDIQFSENSHRRPPPHEEAHAYAQYWALLEARGHTFSLAEFSKRVGRSSGAVRAALAFVKLPSAIRNAVAGRWSSTIPEAKLLKKEKLRLAYGIAVELTRLAKAGFSEKKLVARMVEAVIAGTKVEHFHEVVNKLVGIGKQDVFELMSEAVEAEARLIYRRRTVEAGVSKTLLGQEKWFAKVLTLFEEGLLGKADSPFALGTVLNRMIRVAELYERVYRLTYKRPSAEARDRLKKVRAAKKEAQVQLLLV